MVGLTNQIFLSSETPDDLKREIQNLRQDLKAINTFIGSAFFNGKILKDQAVTTGTKDFHHGLDRNWTGFLIVKKVGACDVTEVAGTYDKRTLIRLTSSVARTVDILVF